MKLRYGLFMLILAAFAAFASGSAVAARVSVVIGAPLFSPGYYPTPYYAAYYPPYAPYSYAVAPAGPTSYIERQIPEQPRDSWYYCAESKSYYPYVKSCPGAWERVSPQPPPAH